MLSKADLDEDASERSSCQQQCPILNSSYMAHSTSSLSLGFKFTIKGPSIRGQQFVFTLMDLFSNISLSFLPPNFTQHPHSGIMESLIHKQRFPCKVRADQVLCFRCDLGVWLLSIVIKKNSSQGDAAGKLQKPWEVEYNGRSLGHWRYETFYEQFLGSYNLML